MEIKYTKDAVKQLSSLDKPIKFVAETEPLPDEVEAIRKIDAAIANNELYDESSINWD